MYILYILSLLYCDVLYVGIKKNLQRTFESWDSGSIDDSGGGFDASNNPLRCRLLFLLACFHAVMQERRTYIPQGWTKFYEFSYGDLKAGTYVMEAVSEVESNGRAIDWETIYGLMEDAIYGGRIDNVYDQRVLRAHLRYSTVLIICFLFVNNMY